MKSYQQTSKHEVLKQFNLENVRGSASTTLENMIATFRTVFPEFKTFADCGEKYHKVEDNSKRKAIELMTELWGSYLASSWDSLPPEEFATGLKKIITKGSLIDQYTRMRLTDNILKSSILLPKFQELCHRLLLKARRGEELEAELDDLIRFIQIEGKGSPTAVKQIPTYLMMVANPQEHIFIKPSYLERFLGKLDCADLLRGEFAAAIYSRIQRRFKALQLEIKEIAPRDMIDLQTFYFYLGRNREEEPEAGDMINTFLEFLVFAGLNFDGTLTRRFVAALLAKPFVILTGLSGSGKTKIAQAFVRWISEPISQKGTSFKVGDEIKVSRSTYKVLDVDRLGLKINQGGQDSITFLPFDLIDSWCEVIVEKGFTDSTPSQTIQQAVLEKGIPYSSTLNSFHSPLKALAFWKLSNATSETVAQYQLVPVGADWTNNEHLLGYANALNDGEYVMPDTGVLQLLLDAEKNEAKPFFLILDEMNLSHVERYFADFLSAMESGEKIHLYKGATRQANGQDIPKTIVIPKNLFVIGTVNVDETTYMFSPKVLDRAQVIEFRVDEKEMNGFLDANPDREIHLTNPDVKGAGMAKSFLDQAAGSCPVQPGAAEILKKFFKPLSEVGAEFGYRTAKDFMTFVGHYMELAPEAKLDDAIDFAIMQKLLPKLHGSTTRLSPVLEELLKLCDDKDTDSKDQTSESNGRYLVSTAKLKRMQKQLQDNGYASFAEA